MIKFYLKFSEFRKQFTSVVQEHRLYLIVRYEILVQTRKLNVQNLILADTGIQENSVHQLCKTFWPKVASP